MELRRLSQTENILISSKILNRVDWGLPRRENMDSNDIIPTCMPSSLSTQGFHAKSSVPVPASLSHAENDLISSKIWNRVRWRPPRRNKINSNDIILACMHRSISAQDLRAKSSVRQRARSLSDMPAPLPVL